MPFREATLRSALKLEKSAISKVQKHIICIFKNGKKSIFAPVKSLKLPKMQFLDWKNRIFGSFKLFSGAKNVFLHFWNCTFFLILEHCGNDSALEYYFLILYFKKIYRGTFGIICFSSFKAHHTKRRSIGMWIYIDGQCTCGIFWVFYSSIQFRLVFWSCLLRR